MRWFARRPTAASQPCLFFYGTPEWAASEDGRNCAGRHCAVYPPISTETRAAFADFAAAAARRYGPGGDFWETPLTSQVAEAPRPRRRPGIGGAGPCDLLPIPARPRLRRLPRRRPIRRIPTEPPCGCTEPHPIATWQIWNEQNSPKYFAPEGRRRAATRRCCRWRSDGDHGRSIRAPRSCSAACGARTRRKKVRDAGQALPQALYAIGGIEESFDSIALHPYAQQRERLARSARSARADRQAAPATGASGSGSPSSAGPAGGPKSNPYVKGLKGQARLLTQGARGVQAASAPKLEAPRGVLVLVARQGRRRRDLRLVRPRRAAHEAGRREAGVERVRLGGRAR